MKIKNPLFKEYKWAFLYALLPGIMSVIISSPSEVAQGFYKILVADNLLITDYFALAGYGAALANVSAVTLISVFMMYISKLPLNGTGILAIGLMSGFSFFGKNVFNMWFIFLGTLIYCKVAKEPFVKHLAVSLFSTALSPLISHLFFYGGTLKMGNMLLALLCGVIIGFVMPMMGPYAGYLLNGMSLYTSGFAVGLLCLVLVPILKSFGYVFNPVTVWTSGNNTIISIILFAFCAVLIAAGIKKGGKQAIYNFTQIQKRPGIASDDFTQLDGIGAVLINMGACGIAATAYILIINGDLNGPTIGGILTVIGFAAKGKHLLNILPIMLGVGLGGVAKQWNPNAPAAQLAALFGTSLAPISGSFGPIAGIVTGFIHSSVVQHAGIGYSGVNLYNNGYAAGIVSIVVYPIFVRLFKRNRYSEPSPGSPAHIKMMQEAAERKEE